MKTKIYLLSALAIALSACQSNPNYQKQPQTSTSGTINPAVTNRNNLTATGSANRLNEARANLLRQSISDETVKNVILIIGDGTSDSELTSARNYLYGAAGHLQGIDVLPFTGAYSNYAINKDQTFEYVTDSAASATAWATGTKTYKGAIGVDLNGDKKPSLLEIAAQNGLATGNITTTAVQDATPASQYAHISDRECFTTTGKVYTATKECFNNSKKNNLAPSISDQLIQNNPADITMGGGTQYLGNTLLADAKSKFNYITTLSELNQLNDLNKPVLGLFSKDNLPVIWKGENPKPNNRYSVTTCVNNPEHAGTPLLKDMAAKSLQLLSNSPKAKKGIFLQIESGSIDLANHAANACGQLGETKQLDDTVKLALDWAKAQEKSGKGKTLIIVTGDHAHTSQIIPADKVATSPGKTYLLKTKDGSLMAMNYATAKPNPKTGEYYQWHTGAQVRIAGYGPHAYKVNGFIDQTDLFHIIQEALAIK